TIIVNRLGAESHRSWAISPPTNGEGIAAGLKALRSYCKIADATSSHDRRKSLLERIAQEVISWGDSTELVGSGNGHLAHTRNIIHAAAVFSAEACTHHSRRVLAVAESTGAELVCCRRVGRRHFEYDTLLHLAVTCCVYEEYECSNPRGARR